MHHLHIDLETFSDISIKKSGAWRYFESPSFEILLFGYSVDGAPVQVIDLASGERLPDWLRNALTDPEYLKYAYNAHFEFGALSRVYGPMDPSQWRCVMMHGLYAGYCAGLESIGSALGLPEDKAKLRTGKKLIKHFCEPCKPSKSNGGRTRNLPEHNPDLWKSFKEYNVRDVETEMEVEERLSVFPVPDFVQKEWETDLRINQRGVAIDIPLAEGALEVGAELREELMAEATEISGLQNPNSRDQLLAWLNDATEDSLGIEDVRKDTITALLEREDNSPEVQRMLEIRRELGKTSTKKYNAIEACTCDDGRIRGLLQYYGASRTGRWAGRLVQIQNLPRTYTKAITVARELVKRKSMPGLEVLYGSVSDTLSQLIRTVFIPSPGNVFIDADFSAIEARVLAWVAGEQWALDAFRTHGKIYEATASQMFGVPMDCIKKGRPEYAYRAKGKVATLALGYQGGASALVAMGALNSGLTEEELPDIVNRWRSANPHIRAFWYAVENAAKTVILQGGRQVLPVGGGDSKLVFSREYDAVHDTVTMSVELPSGRKLYYIHPSIGLNRFGSETILYYGVGANKHWQRLETYGGKITENLVQAIARDLLAEAVERLEAAGFPIVFTIHDEVVIDKKPYADSKAMLADVVRLMAAVPSWCKSLPLSADGWVGQFFTKD